jgi:hypothetical protein
MTGDAPKPDPHPVARYLERVTDTEANFQDHRRRMLDALEQLSQYFADNLNEPPPMTVSSELSDGLAIYIYAHEQTDDLSKSIPDHLKKFAERARNHVGNGGEFCLDHALEIIDPPFKGPKPKGPGEHKHRHIFLMTFYDWEVARTAKSQIDALRNASKHEGSPHFEEKYLDGEYSKWRDKNKEWLIWIFDLA